MKKIFTTLALLSAVVSASAVTPKASAPKAAQQQQNKPFKWAHKAKAGNVLDLNTFVTNASKKAGAPALHELPASGTLQYLDGPDGSTWYAVCNTDTEQIPLPGGVAFDKVIKGFEYTVYDSKFNKIGTVKDKITLGENETRAAAIQIDPTITKKFFNNDEKYEVMVYQAINTNNYTNNYYTKAYQLDGATDTEGNNEVLASFNGYVVDAINAAGDAWSEKYLMTLYTEEQPDPEAFDDYIAYLNEWKGVLTTYKSKGWDDAPSVINVEKIAMQQFPGDQESTPFMITKKHDGTVYFIFSQYAKPYFVDPIGEDESATPDNSLVITVKKSATPSAAKLTDVSTTTIAATALPEKGFFYTYYGIGTLNWDKDIDFVNFGATKNSPSFTVTVNGYNPQNEQSAGDSYYAYNNAGERVATFAENIGRYYNISDVPGFDPQTLFIYENNEDYTLKFTNMANAQTDATIGSQIDGKDISAYIDRVPAGNSYKYVCKFAIDELQDNGDFTSSFAWLNPDGSLDHIDNVNIGKDVVAAIPYINAQGINPYLFDTDPEMEYLMLVNRYVSDESTETSTELIVADTKDNIIFSAKPHETKGRIATVSLTNTESNPTLMVVYYDGTYYHQDAYELPLVKFAGGDGTEANPYRIATVGDLQQIKSAPSANYIVVNDIDGEGYTFNPIENFTGVLDGDGKTISKLTIGSNGNGVAMFADMSGEDVTPTVKNLNFVNPVLNIGGEDQFAAVVAGTAVSTNISNVHIYGLSADNAEFNGEFGGLVSMLNFNSTISESSLAGARINLPAASSIGGIVAQTRTTSKVLASSFTGAITGKEYLGGIVARVGTENDVVENCHVDADITGSSYIGGVVAESARATINRNYVEGNISALQTGRWDNYIAVGGVVGQLQADWTATSDKKVVSNNLVALKSITVGEVSEEPSFENEQNTAHRIVGYTCVNEDPYGEEPLAADKGLDNNYVISPIEAFDATIGEEAANSTEGKSQSMWDIDEDFYTALGMTFGQNLENPWRLDMFYDPALYFEKSIVAAKNEIEVAVGSDFTIDINLYGREDATLEDIYMSFNSEYDTEKLEATYNDSLEGNTLSLGFKCLAEGQSDVVLNIMGTTVTVTVTGVKDLGVSDINADNKAQIVYNGNEVSAQGATLKVYTVGGQLVAQGNDTLSLTTLEHGVYIVTASNAHGVAVLKIAK